uniref:RNA-directed RNA polymerase n=1 Tax=Riboviria sp. TaxID=2585031 RepID=A0A514D6N8_9VIRU|nr:MAG: RNA-dependent RNA polymerase [Riboviria sp.]
MLNAPELVRHVVRAIEECDTDTSAGSPWNAVASKKETWIGDRRGLITLTLERLLVLLDLKRTETALEMVKMGARDPVHTFIKEEPHKQEKIAAERYRIISCVSVLDHIIERCLFTAHNKAEIDLHEHFSFKPGMGLHDEGKQHLYDHFRKCQTEFTPASTDVSAWDWSVSGWMLEDDAEYRVAVVGGAGTAWATLVRNYTYSLSLKVFSLPTGDLFEQTTPGVLPSGTYNTSSTNSHMRHMLAKVVRLDLGCTVEYTMDGAQMGDDAQEPFVEGLESGYKSFGFLVKGVSTSPLDEFSFCSTAWRSSWKGEPESWKRTVFRFLTRKPEEYVPEMRGALDFDLRHLSGKESVLARCDQWVAENFRV